MISSRKQENVNRAVSELKSKGFQNVLGVKCHVGDENDRNSLFRETIAKFGGIDIFVSNAAVNPAVGMCVRKLTFVFNTYLSFYELHYQALCWIAVKKFGIKSLTLM